MNVTAMWPVPSAVVVATWVVSKKILIDWDAGHVPPVTFTLVLGGPEAGVRVIVGVVARAGRLETTIKGAARATTTTSRIRPRRIRCPPSPRPAPPRAGARVFRPADLRSIGVVGQGWLA